MNTQERIKCVVCHGLGRVPYQVGPDETDMDYCIDCDGKGSIPKCPSEHNDRACDLAEGHKGLHQSGKFEVEDGYYLWGGK